MRNRIMMGPNKSKAESNPLHVVFCVGILRRIRFKTIHM